MNITIHRGSKEIGGSCVEIESQGKRLLIDLGLPLDAVGDLCKFLPKVSGLDGNDPSLLGILISHPHQDHFGLLSQISSAIKIGMGTAARRILTTAAPFMHDKYSPPSSVWDFESEKPLLIEPFKIIPYLVDHSAYDSYALLIEADGKKIFYSGDFRAHGRKSSLYKKMIENPPSDIDLLLLEGTSIGRSDSEVEFQNEAAVQKGVEGALNNTKGLVLVQTSPQNIDRVVSVFKACKRTGRILVIDLYTSAILEATGNKKLPQSSWEGVVLYLPELQVKQVDTNGWGEIHKRHSANEIVIEAIRKNPGKYALLFRSMHCMDLGKNDCLKDALFIYSQWGGYWKRDSFKKVRSWLKRHNIPKIEIHTSGHAGLTDLQKFAEALNPRKIVPIHSFMPVEFINLFPNVEIHKDGDSWSIV